MPYFTTDDNYRIYYEEYGKENSQPIVFVHGHGGRLGYYKHQLEGLKDKYHVVAYDMRGHGASDKTVKNLDMLRLGKDLHDLIEELHLVNPVLVGWSLGSNIVLAELMQYGYDNVHSVVTIDNSPKMINDEDWKYGAFKDINEAVAFWQNAMKGWKEYASGFVPVFFGGGEYNEEDYRYVEETYPDNTNDTMIPILISNNTVDFRPALKNMTVPYMITYGTRPSFYAPETIIGIAEECVPGCRVQGFDGGHTAFMQDWENFNAALDDFIQNGK